MFARNANIIVQDCGSVVLIDPLDAETRAAIQKLTNAEGWQWFGGALCVEPRYAPALIDALDRGEGF